MMNRYTKIIKSNSFAFLLLAASATLCTLPLLLHQQLFITHDIYFHIFQSDQFYKSLTAGSLLPRWVLDSNRGYGSANFIFYSPLSYYVVSLFHLGIPALVGSMIAAIWTSFFLSGIAMFFAARKFAAHTPALLCSIAYQLAPFHIFALHIRGGFAELFAFIWYPLVFVFFYQTLVSKRNSSTYAALAICYAGLILTHLVSAFIVTILLISYLVFSFSFWKYPKNFLTIVASLTTGLGLASFFLLPAIHEQSFVKTNYLTSFNFCNYKRNFLFSFNNPYIDIHNFIIPVTFSVGLMIIVFLIVVFNLSKLNNSCTDHRYRGFFVYAFLLALLMASPLSEWIWDLSPSLQTTQFPWRWIAYLEMALLMLMAHYLTIVKNNSKTPLSLRYRMPLYVLVLLIACSIVIIFSNKHETNRISMQETNKILNPKKFGYYLELPKEYTPAWVNNLGKLLQQPDPQPVSIRSGSAFAEAVVWNPEQRIINVQAHAPSLLRIATFFYPGWIADVDGTSTKVFMEKESGAMLIPVEPGNHVLTLKFVDTAYRKCAQYISVLSLLILCVFCLITGGGKIRPFSLAKEIFTSKDKQN